MNPESPGYGSKVDFSQGPAGHPAEGAQGWRILCSRALPQATHLKMGAAVLGEKEESGDTHNRAIHLCCPLLIPQPASHTSSLEAGTVFDSGLRVGAHSGKWGRAWRDSMGFCAWAACSPCASDLWLPGLSALFTCPPHPHGV